MVATASTGGSRLGGARYGTSTSIASTIVGTWNGCGIETGQTMSFVHLDVRSYFSLKEGAFAPEQLAEQAAGLGMSAVTMTDRDGLYGAARFVSACHRNGVKPILGASLTVRAPAPPPRDAHVVLVAEDATGYANLCRLLTDAHLLGDRGDPWV